MRTISHTIPFAIAVGLALASSVAADTITLRPSIRLTGGATTVRLGDIAVLQGSEAEALANVEIGSLKSPDSVTEFSVRDIRTKLDQTGIHWGRVNLSGRSVVVRPNRDPGTQPPLAMAAVSIADDDRADHARTNREDVLAADVVDQPTVRGSIANLLMTHLRRPAEDIRLVCDSTDAALLDSNTNSARFEVQPLSSLSSDRIELRVRKWEGGSVKSTRTITVRPLVRMQGCAVRQDLPKNHTVTESDVEEATSWESPAVAAQLVGRESACGGVTTQSMNAGDMVRTRDIRHHATIKRGDVATVRCLVGGTVITLTAHAVSDGEQGELIEFRKPGERDSFRATVTGKSEAVMDLTRR